MAVMFLIVGLAVASIGVFIGMAVHPMSAPQEAVQAIYFVIGALGLVIAALGAVIQALDEVRGARSEKSKQQNVPADAAASANGH